MHMSDALISVAVGTTMTAVSAGAIGYSIKKIKKIELEDNKIPMMGVMGAFVFAAQMVNFTIPVTGSSGHIGGGILLAALLGPYPALITLASVLLIQALFFADGGLLALGCNIFNMGVIPCLLVYPLIYRSMLKNKITPKRITIAAIVSAIVGLQLGAFSVVLETLASGISELPFTAFVALMQPIHLAIGIVEGIITAAVLCFIYNVRRDIIENALGRAVAKNGSMKKVLVVLAVTSVLIGGGLSLFASAKPDGLEWAIQGVANTTELETDSEVHSAVQKVQTATAFLPDYSYKEEGALPGNGTSLSGIVGGMFTLMIVVIAGAAIISIKKIKQTKTSRHSE